MQGETRDVDARANFEMDVAGLQSAYELRGTPAWAAAVEAIASADKVHVAGFQTIAGLASGFATRLAYLRDELHAGRRGGGGGHPAGRRLRHALLLGARLHEDGPAAAHRVAAFPGFARPLFVPQRAAAG